MRLLLAGMILFSASGCAVLHHVQVGEVDGRTNVVSTPIDIKVSETGINLGEAKDIAKGLSRNKQTQKDLDDLEAIVSLFQQGPRTGNPVYSETYAKDLILELYKVCPSGRITNLMAIRETRKYPVISGEIIKIKGSCITERSRRSAHSTSTQQNI